MISKQIQATVAAIILNMCAVSVTNVASAQDYATPGSPYGDGQIQQTRGVVVETPSQPGTYVPGGQYPQLNAPLYPHTYHAMYPPFYYKVHGGWFWTPFGFRQHEHWKLQGTEVNVKYRSHYPLFGGWHPPVIR
jgi:hypothetical protein